MRQLLSKVFISYSAPDRPFARQLAARIEAAGFAPWLDERDLVVGDVLPERIAATLRQTRVVVVIISRASVLSKWLRYELAIATDQMIKGECRVIPVVIDDVAVPPMVQALLYSDCRVSLDQGWQSILVALRQEQNDVYARSGFVAQINALMGEVFPDQFIMSGATRRIDDHSVIRLQRRGIRDDLTMRYVIVIEAHVSRITDSWWKDYVVETEVVRCPCSLIVCECSVDIPLDRVSHVTRRVGVKDIKYYSYASHKVFFVDLHEIETEPQTRELLQTAKDFVLAEAIHPMWREPQDGLT